MKVEGGTTKVELKFYHRDAYECFKFLFGNPLYRKYFEVQAEMLFEDETMSSQLHYGIMNGKLAWDLQVRLVHFVHQISIINITLEFTRRR